MQPVAPVGRWGTHDHGLDPRTRAFAQAQLGPAAPAPPPGSVPITPSRLGAAASLVPGIRIEIDDDIRARSSRGMSYADLLAWRRTDGEPQRAVDAVAFPTDHEQALAVVQACAREGVVVVPVGGGTSVTGAIDAGRIDDSTSASDRRAVLAVSTAAMRALLDLDTESGIATVQAGITGPELEAALDGFTLGHFPQSWERASIGGYIAARSSGQSSGGYGRIEDMLVGAELATPIGSWKVGGYPMASSGPDLRHLVLGSEGSLGVITTAQLRVRPASSVREYAAAIVPSGSAGGFGSGIDIARVLARSPLRPSVLRVSDPAETEALLTMSAPGGVAGKAFDAYLRVRRARPGSLIILGWEGDDGSMFATARADARGAVADAGGVWLGAGPGRSWARGRFNGAYLRDDLMDAGYLVETFETVTRWSDLAPLHARVSRTAREQLGANSYVMAHISHTYDTGASVYFTVLAGGWSDPQRDIARWQECKRAITQAIVDAGGALSHHHGIGRDHAPWLPGQLGPVGLEVLRGIKASVDPSGVMNPGVLIGEGQ